MWHNTEPTGSFGVCNSLHVSSVTENKQTYKVYKVSNGQSGCVDENGVMDGAGGHWSLIIIHSVFLQEWIM